MLVVDCLIVVWMSCWLQMVTIEIWYEYPHESRSNEVVNKYRNTVKQPILPQNLNTINLSITSQYIHLA